MSRRIPTTLTCHFCGGFMHQITDGPLYCYGCREPKNAAGFGRKDDISGGLILGELPSETPQGVRDARVEARRVSIKAPQDRTEEEIATLAMVLQSRKK